MAKAKKSKSRKTKPRKTKPSKSKPSKSKPGKSDPTIAGAVTSEFGHTDVHSAERLGDQRPVQFHAERLKAAPSIHAKQRLLSEIAFYPKHAKRTETPEYKKVHKDMVVAKDLPCLVCGVQNSTLKDPRKNTYGARQMETHHHVVEWALANAIDVGKFNRILRPNLAHKHPDNPMYKKAMSEQQILDWVDHSSDNLWVLCDVHHRAKYFGIHEITYPIWCPMDMLEPHFDDYVRTELKKESAADKKPPGKAGAKKASPKAKKKKAKKARKAKKAKKR
jgi:hypothetical protein